MGWLTKALSPEDPAAPLWPTSWSNEGVGSNDSGVAINEINSRSAAGVLACTRVISEAAAAYPKNIYQRVPNGKIEVPDHPLFPMVHDCPNPSMTNVVFWNAVITQTCLNGNGYAEIRRDGSMRARELWPLPSFSTKPHRSNGVLTYRTSAGVQGGGDREILPQNIIHIPFLSIDGIQGQSPIQIKRQSLGLSVAAERFGAKFFGRGARPSGILETTDSLKKEQRDNLRQSMQEGMSGDSALGLALMPPGVSFKPLMISPEEAQFLQTRKWQVEDIARDYRVPATMIGLLERASHSNAEQLGYDFSTYTMLHWVQLIEQELNRKLFTGPFFCKLDMDVFLRGDFETRTKGYQVLRNIGQMSANDINRREGWPLISEEEGGDIRLVPLNMTPLQSMVRLANEPPEKVEPPIAPEGGQPADASSELRSRFSAGYLRMFSDATGRTINREKRDAASVRRVWLPVLLGLAESISAVSGHSELSEDVLPFLDDYTGAIALRCQAWKKESSSVTAATEFDRAYTAIAGKV